MSTARRGVLFIFLAAFAMLALAQSGDEAIAKLQEAVNSDPQNVDAWVDLGQAFLEADRLEEAKDSFLEAIAIDYLSGDAHFGLGLTEYARGDYQAAIFAFNEVARLYPERFDGQFNRAVTLARLRQTEESVQAFNEAIAQAEPEASSEDLTNAYLGLAGQLKRLERYAEASEAYGAAFDLNPDNNELAYLRAEALYRAGRGLEALADLTELETRSSDYRVSALIADIYVEASQIDYALRSLDRALRKAENAGSPDAQANILIKLGLLQRGLGREAEAAGSFQRAARVDPNSYQALYNLGVSYLESGQPRSALSALEDAMALNKDSGQVRLALATAYDQLAQPEPALQQAEAALSRLDEPELLGEANFIMGRALYRLGDYRGASIALGRVVTEQPDNAQAQLWAGLAAYQQGDYRTAIQYYERSVQLNPNSIEARINLGAAYLASERYRDAELVYQLLTQENPGDAEAQYNLGWALFSQNRREEARQVWQQALELGYQPAQTALQEYF